MKPKGERKKYHSNITIKTKPRKLVKTKRIFKVCELFGKLLLTNFEYGPCIKENNSTVINEKFPEFDTCTVVK